jgi:hypothetical protein
VGISEKFPYGSTLAMRQGYLVESAKASEFDKNRAGDV